MIAGKNVHHYRGYIIERRWVTKTGKPQPDEWGFVHDDFDGPGDARAGYGPTLQACMTWIDELEDDEDEH